MKETNISVVNIIHIFGECYFIDVHVGRVVLS